MWQVVLARPGAAAAGREDLEGPAHRQHLPSPRHLRAHDEGTPPFLKLIA